MEVLRDLVLGDGAGTTHGFLDGGANLRVKRGERIGNCFGRHAQVLGAYMVELFLEVTQSRGTALLDIVKNRTHQIGGFGSAHCSARHRGQQFGTGQFLTTEVDDSHDVLAHKSPS